MNWGCNIVKLTQVERLFFGRKDILAWVDSWLQKCEGRGIILGIDGMGGIGKTAILQELDKIHKYSIFVDCSKHDMMTLLNTISIRARYIGFDTPRFNHLRDIRLWFLEGIQPAKPESKGWVKDLVVWIPEINTVVKIANAISTAGKKLNQLITKHCESLEQWFIDMLGEAYGTKILELLVHNPEQTLNLFLESMAADLNSSPTREDLPLLIMLDSFEHINSLNYDETPYPEYGIKLNQAEKWHVFLSKLNGTVGLVSGRSLPHIPESLSIQRYDKEISELDEESCKMLLDKRGVMDAQLVRSIINVTHRNPFVISTICDIADRGELHLEEIIKLESEALLEVRERTWNLFFSKAKDIWKFIDCAALIPFFDYEIMHILNPELNKLYWKELVSFSFVQYDEPYWYIHDLAKDLALAELGTNTKTLVDDIRSNLREAFNRTQNPVFLGLLLSATNHISEKIALSEIEYTVEVLRKSQRITELISILETYEPASIFGQGIIQYQLGVSFLDLNRFGDARIALSESLKCNEETENLEKPESRSIIAQLNEMIAVTYLRMGDNKLTEEHYVTALGIFEEISTEFPEQYLRFFMGTLGNIGAFYIETARMSIGEGLLIRALKISDTLSIEEVDDLGARIVILNALGNLYKDTNRLTKAETTYNQAIDDAEKYSDLVTDELIDILCKIYSNLGLLYFNTDELIKTRECYSKSMGLLSKLEESRPDLHRFFLPDLHINIGLLDAFEINFEQAIISYDKALSIYRELAEENPRFYLKDIAMVQFNRGLAFHEIGNTTNSISAFEESRRIYSQLKVTEPDLYNPKLANVFSHLGDAYTLTDRLNDSEKVINESLKLFRNLDSEILQLHMDEYAFALNHKGILEYRLGHYKDALKNFRKSLKIFDELSETNPSGYI